MLRNRKALAALGKAKSPRAVERIWRADLNRFKRIRQKYLLYR